MMKDPGKDDGPETLSSLHVLVPAERTANSRADDDQSPWSYVHRWTLSRHLWEADSSFTFARMWRERPHFIIMNYSFDHFLQCGRGDDVDEFADILLSV
jgi:hypothetical protein